MIQSSIINKLQKFGVSLETTAPPLTSTTSRGTQTAPIMDDVCIAELQLEETASAYDQLQSLGASLESIAANNGLSVNGYRLYQHAFNAITNATSAADQMPSLESFNVAAKRLSNTQVALEDVRQKAKDMIVAFWKFFTDLVDQVIKKFTSGPAKVEATIEKMEELVWTQSEPTTTPEFNPKKRLHRDALINLNIGLDEIERGGWGLLHKTTQKWMDYADHFSNHVAPFISSSAVELLDLIDVSDNSYLEGISKINTELKQKLGKYIDGEMWVLGGYSWGVNDENMVVFSKEFREKSAKDVSESWGDVMYVDIEAPSREEWEELRDSMFGYGDSLLLLHRRIEEGSISLHRKLSSNTPAFADSPRAPKMQALSRYSHRLFKSSLQMHKYFSNQFMDVYGCLKDAS